MKGKLGPCPNIVDAFWSTKWTGAGECLTVNSYERWVPASWHLRLSFLLSFCFVLFFKTTVLQSWLFIRFLGTALWIVTLLDICLCPKFFFKILYSHEQLLSPSLPRAVCRSPAQNMFWGTIPSPLKASVLKTQEVLHQKQFLFLWRLMRKKKKKTPEQIRAFVCFIGFLDWPCNMLSPLHFAQKVVKKRPLIPLFKIYIIWVCTKVASQVVVWAFGRDQIMNSVTNLCFAHSKGLLLFEFLWVILFTFISHDTHMSLGCKYLNKA